jgi:CDP-glucose 4,6-dehydratase
MHDIIKFYKNKKILITGVTGFKGSWLSYWLLKLNSKIVGIGFNSKKKHKLFESLEIAKKIKVNYFDIRDKQRLEKIIKNFKPSIIFHLAAQPIVSETYKNPYETLDVNIKGTLNVIDISTRYKFIKSIVSVTSAHCYENQNKNISLKETDKLGGNDPYSASKACSELLIKSYKNNYFTKKGISSVRASNIIGGGDWSKNRLIPDCINYLKKDLKIKLRNPNHIRPWQFILEPLRGYLLLAYNQYNYPKKFSSEWNFGPKNSDCISVKNVVKQIIYIYGKGSIQKIKSEFSENSYLKLNSLKAEKELNWKPIYNVKKSIKKTIEWYNLVINKKKNPKIITNKQINEYMKACKWL